MNFFSDVFRGKKKDNAYEDQFETLAPRKYNYYKIFSQFGQYLDYIKNSKLRFKNKHMYDNINLTMIPLENVKKFLENKSIDIAEKNVILEDLNIVTKSVYNYKRKLYLGDFDEDSFNITVDELSTLYYELEKIKI